MKPARKEPRSPSLDARFAHERSAFALVFSCEGCAHFDRGVDACVHRYPIERHVLRAFENANGGTFCKEFELE
ncbi:MAG: hypothetical protein Q8Q09_29445 [Deltaproteobacteria bacterium]|nr:hypothetical protein [Deltaproteobacteria bacterium]